MLKRFICFVHLFFIVQLSIAQPANEPASDIAPNFTVIDLHGTEHTLYQYTDSGKYVLIDFFAYWCGSCLSKAPIMDEFYAKYGCNNFEVVVIGIEADGSNEQLEIFNSNAGLSSLSYPSCSGLEGNGNEVKLNYGISVFPTLMLIGPDRKLISANIYPSNTATEIYASFPENSIFEHPCDANAIDEIYTDNIKIHPNPTTGKLTITSQIAPKSITVYNIIGQKMGTWKIGKTISEIDLSDLKNGFYYINFGDNLTTTFKVVKY